jgi:TonB family protein
MTRLLACVLISFLAVSAASAQNAGNGASRGFIPPLFTLPEDHEELRFTSSALPEFPVADYPEMERKNGIEGVAELRLYVTAEGDVVFAEVSVSSGRSSFDEAALKSAMHGHFPEGYATIDGLPRDFTIAVPYYFLLSSDPELYWHSRLELARVQQEYELIMSKFEDLLLKRTTATESKMKEVQRSMEDKVSIAKRLHRVLAEKKERAIIRIRQEIETTREEQDRMLADRDDNNWRSGTADPEDAAIMVAFPGSSVTTRAETGLEGVERLNHELDMKRSYM